MDTRCEEKNGGDDVGCFTTTEKVQIKMKDDISMQKHVPSLYFQFSQKKNWDDCCCCLFVSLVARRRRKLGATRAL